MNLYKTIFTKISKLLEEHLGDKVQINIEKYKDGYEEYQLNIEDTDIWITCDDNEMIVGGGYNHLHISEDYGNIREGIEILLDIFTKRKRITQFYKGKYCYKTQIEIEVNENKYEDFSTSVIFIFPFWRKTKKEVFFENELINIELVKQEIEEIRNYVEQFVNKQKK